MSKEEIEGKEFKFDEYLLEQKKLKRKSNILNFKLFVFFSAYMIFFTWLLNVELALNLLFILLLSWYLWNENKKGRSLFEDDISITVILILIIVTLLFIFSVWNEYYRTSPGIFYTSPEDLSITSLIYKDFFL